MLESLKSLRPFRIPLAIPALLLSLSVPGLADAGKAASAGLRPCRFDGVEGEARCGAYAVWEDRAAKKGRRIDLHVVVLPALGPERAPDPVFYLPGGPGEGATEVMKEFAGWTDLRRRRDLVFVDQRGTGSSNPLRCDLFATATVQEIADHLFAPDRVRRCRKELEKRADLRLYTTSIAADDLDEVRAWLGYGKINLLAGSYGTKLAQVYLRHHGGRVRSAVLDGIVPLDDPAPLLYARVGQRAVDLLLGECAADAVCHQAFPGVREELFAVLERIDRGVTVRITDPRSRKEVEVRPNRGLVAEGIRYLLYSQAAGQLPLLIHRAYQGDLGPLVTAALGRRAVIDRGIAAGLFLSVTCAEEVPFIDPAAVPRETAGTMLRDFRIREQQQACALWPRGQVPPQDRENVRSDVPVLLISGERDPVTPPEFGERVAAGLPNSLHIVRPRGNHGSGGPCIEGLVVAFFERGSAAGLDLSCVQEGRKPDFATELPSELEGQEAFLYRPEKVAVGKVYHYVKTNLDGSHPEHVSIRVADRDRIESFKFHPGEEPAALVIAKMDWSQHSVASLESWQVFADGTKKLAATLRDQGSGKVRVEIPLLGTPAETVAIPRSPWHVYNFDLASLNFAFPHLKDPKGRFTIGIADPTFRQEGPAFVYKGEVEVSYVGEEPRGGVACRKYWIDGKGLENRGGFLWAHATDGHFVDMEIDLPDNPAWKTFKFQLQKVEEMDPAAWERFRKAQLQAAAEAPR